MVRRDYPGRVTIALLAAALVSLCHAQPQAPTNENQARYYVYGAFLTHAVPEIIGQPVALGPELAQRLGVAPGAERQRVYDALMTYTDGKPLNVRKASADELARYKRDFRQPVFRVQAGEITLLVEYDMQANTIPFVGQLNAVYQPSAPAAAPRAAPAPVPPPVAAAVRKPPAAQPAPPPAPARELLKPNGPCVVQAVMSEQDLANCRGAAARITPVDPGPPIVVKPQAVRAEPPPRRTGPCEVKPVMSEEDLANCRSAPITKVDPGPPAVAKPQARIESTPAPRRGPCLIKPVMSEEDLANCRSAPLGKVDPGPPPAVAKPQPVARPEPAAPRAPCVIKPVMSEEDRIACGMR